MSSTEIAVRIELTDGTTRAHTVESYDGVDFSNGGIYVRYQSSPGRMTLHFFPLATVREFFAEGPAPKREVHLA